MKRKGMTAAELFSELSTDPEYQAHKAERERIMELRKAKYADDEKELVSEIRELGYEIDSVWDLVNNRAPAVLGNRFRGSYVRAYPILVRHLSVQHQPRIREGIIRSLMEKDAKEVASEALLEELRKEKDPELRWVIAMTLKKLLSPRERREHPELEGPLKS